MYKLISAALLLLLSNAIFASEMEPFTASYKVFRDDQYVADASFSLAQRNGVWVWSMGTRARGIYSWLTRKKPFIYTHVQENSPGQPLLSMELSGDYPDKSAQQASWFDYDKKMVYFSDKKKQLKLPFSTPIYNYHSINLLYPQMKLDGANNRQIQFYKKGKLLTANVRLETDIEIPDGDSVLKVDKLTQTYPDNKDVIQYYYQDGKLAPLKIEQIKRDFVSVMWRDSLK